MLGQSNVDELVPPPFPNPSATTWSVLADFLEITGGNRLSTCAPLSPAHSLGVEWPA